VDPTRTFVAGFSGGAFFAQSLRCFDEDITAIATFAGGLEGQPFPSTSQTEYGFLRNDAGGFLRIDPATCATTRVPQLLVHGASDVRVPREQVMFVAERWAAQNGCGPLSGTSLQPTDPRFLDAACFEFVGCAADADLVFCEPAGVDHSVWSPDGTGVLKNFFRRFGL
jgi:poly(3-hydroxybutyrate) depolymerase